MNLDMILNLKDKATARLKKFNGTLDKTNAKMKKNAKLGKGGKGASGGGGLGVLGGTAALSGLALVSSLIKKIAIEVTKAAGNVEGLTNAFSQLTRYVASARGKLRQFNHAAHEMSNSIQFSQDVMVRQVKSIARMGVAADRTKGKIAGLGAWLDKMKFKLFAVAAASFAVFRGIIKSGREFEKLKATLRSVIPEQDSVAEAFAFVQNVASQLPTTLQETTTAFIRMQALGIVPTEERMLSFGNTASAMGKTILQFTEAVADAIVGEMERLKEFGIKAKQEGDLVTFTFQGMSKTVGRNSKEITEYLESIGNVQFAGAAARQMSTLDGKLSNLGDSFSTLGNTIYEAGIGFLVKGIVDITASAVKGITSLIIDVQKVFSWLSLGLTLATVKLGQFGKSIFATGAAQEKINSETDKMVGMLIEGHKLRLKDLNALQDGSKAAADYNEKLKERLALQNKKISGPIEITGGHRLKRFEEFYNELSRSAADSINEIANAEQAVIKLNKGFEEGWIPVEKYKIMMKELQEILGDTEWSEFMIQAFRNMQTEVANFFDDAMTKRFSSFSDGMKQLAVDFARVIRKMVAEWLAAKILTSGFGMFGINTSGPDFRAEGGPVSRGSSYVVGEQGPEVFVPDSNGEIIPNGMGMGGNVANINITAMDGQDAMRVLESNKRFIAELVNGTNRTYNLGAA